MVDALKYLSEWNYKQWKSILKNKEVAGDEILLPRPQMTKPRIQTLLEDNNLDVCNLNCWAVSNSLDLLFPFYTGWPKFWLSLHLYV